MLVIASLSISNKHITGATKLDLWSAQMEQNQNVMVLHAYSIIIDLICKLFFNL